MKNMIPENEIFVPRGIKNVEFKFGKNLIEAEIKVLTNSEVDNLATDCYDKIGEEIEIDIPALSRKRIQVGLIDINTTFGGKGWKELSDDEKFSAIDQMDRSLREQLANYIVGESSISQEEHNFL